MSFIVMSRMMLIAWATALPQVAATSTDMTRVVRVAGAGTRDGNYANFFIGNDEINMDLHSGLNLVALDPNTMSAVHRNESASFQGSGTAVDSDALQKFVDILPAGTLVLAATLGAWSPLDTRAKEALQACGARLVDQFNERNVSDENLSASYALIGTKGGQAHAEEFRKMGHGPAMAVAWVGQSAFSVAAVSNARKPKCNASTKEPPVAGYFSEDNLILDENCQYELRSRSEASACLRGVWVALVGQSQQTLAFGDLVNMLVDGHDYFDPLHVTDRLWSYTFLDIIIRNGKVIYYKQLRLCNRDDIQASQDPQCVSKVAEAIAAAPAFEVGDTRLTKFMAGYWDPVRLMVPVVKADVGWAPAEVVIHVQIITWYLTSSVVRGPYARQDLLDSTVADGLSTFKSEMELALVDLDDFCGMDRIRGCYVLNAQWLQSYAQYPWEQNFTNSLKTGVLSKQFLRYLDYQRLSKPMPSEIAGGHYSAVLDLWAWQILLGGVCPAPSTNASAWAKFVGGTCHADSTFDDCPAYFDKCSAQGSCTLWECIHTEPCELQVQSIEPQSSKTTETCAAFPDVLFSKLSQTKNGACAGQLWENSEKEFLLVAIAVVLAFMTCCFVKYRRWNAVRNTAKKAESSARRENSNVPCAFEAASQVAEQSATLKNSVVNPAFVDLENASKEDDAASQAADHSAALRNSAVDPAFVDLEKASREDERASTGEDMCGGSQEKQAETPTVSKLKAMQDAVLRSPPSDVFPLGLARFCASIHVVVGHLYAKGKTDPVFFFGWGFTWVPWFFMLSGFVLFSADLKKHKEESLIDYVMRRSVTIYPLYAFSLIPAFAIAKGMDTMRADIWTLIAQSFLAQAWWPYITEQTLQQHCWFLSCMVVYWALFKPLAFCLRGLCLLRTCLLMAFCFFLPWLSLIIPALAGQPLDWYKDHRFSRTDTELDIGVIFLKFHPISYLHVFVIGMLLAKLRLLIDVKVVASKAQRCTGHVMQFVAPLGYAALLLIFNIGAFRPELWGYKLSARLSVLLPFQAMILLGLAGLPSLSPPAFSWFCSKLNFLENYSYAVYVIQFLCYSVWPTCGQVDLLLFLVFTVAAAVVIAHAVQQPLQRLWAKHPRGRMLVPLLLAALLAGLSFLPGPDAGTSDDVGDVLGDVRHDSRMVDVRLHLADSGSVGAALINPSLSISAGEVMIAARRHRQETVRYAGTYEGTQATVVDQIWHSEILIGSEPLNSAAWNDWPLTGQIPFKANLYEWDVRKQMGQEKWEDLCVRETWIPANSTLVRKVVTGPEDPKLIGLAGESALAFNSLPPLGAGGCSAGAEVSQMYLSTGVRTGQVATGSKLQFGREDRAEKNWIPFTYQESLFFVYSPLPHRIVASWSDGVTEELFSSTFEPLQQLQLEHPEIDVRGSGQAIFIDDNASTPRLPSAHYLALLHLFNRQTGQYSHYAYRFGAEPPFEILQISEPLPLYETAAVAHGVPFAFASGLVVHNGTVVISYGAGDRDARALVLTLDRLDEMFGHCTSMSQPPETAPPVTVETEAALMHCGLEACTEEVLGRMAGNHSCGDRITWLQTAEGGLLTESHACSQVAGLFPTECGICAAAAMTMTTAPPSEIEIAPVKCGVEACNEEVLGRMAGNHSCGDRITWLQTDEGGLLTESHACSQVAGMFPTECGICAAAATSMTTPPSEITPVKCGVEACTEEVFGRMAGSYSCGGRITWLQTEEGGLLNESFACSTVAGQFPTECGVCR